MRKSFFLGAALAGSIALIAAAQSDKVKEAKEDLSMPLNPNGSDTPYRIHQEIDFTASPQRLYQALIDGKEFTAFSGRHATIDGKAGGTFSLFDGHITGRNIELVPNQSIVQAWRASDWPEGVYSIAKFELQTNGGAVTHLVFDQTGFPEGLHDHLADGWEANYWSLLKKYLR
jgi:activator of HSP90 ATPase